MHPSAADQRGAGLFSMSFGLLVTLLALVFAVQFLYDLYATSVITGHGFDAARDVAGYENEHDRSAAIGAAEEGLRAALGSYDGRLELTWSVDGDSVRLRIEADHPSVLPSLFGPLALDHVDETIVVRAEEPQ